MTLTDRIILVLSIERETTCDRVAYLACCSYAEAFGTLSVLWKERFVFTEPRSRTVKSDLYRLTSQGEARAMILMMERRRNSQPKEDKDVRPTAAAGAPAAEAG